MVSSAASPSALEFSAAATGPATVQFATGLDGCPQGQLPGKAVFSVEEAKNALNPLQHVPIVGMIYRQATGASIPAPLQIAGSVVAGAIFGGPVGAFGSVLLCLATELVRLGPDTSRPAAPEGMTATGSEAGVQPVTPGAPTEPGAYTTLATTLPDFLGGGAVTGTFAVAAYNAGSAIGAG